MKKQIYRMLAGALSLVMVLALMAAFVPVSPANEALADPGDNEWSEFKVPAKGNSGDWVLAPASENVDIGPIARAIDGTLYCYVGPSDNL